MNSLSTFLPVYVCTNYCSSSLKYTHEVFIFKFTLMKQLSNMRIPVHPLMIPSIISESTRCIVKELQILHVLKVRAMAA